MKAISLFSGCGGSDIGAKAAGVEVILANDNYPPAARTYQRHRKLIASEDVDFRDCSITDIRSFPSADLLIGCYPCQSFTMGGPRSPKDDERSRLYREFLRCLDQVKPKYFVAENVAGMKWLERGSYLRRQIATFRAAGGGYHVSIRLLDAKDYGVPADRKRLFLVGVRQDLGLYYWFPKPTHGPGSPNKTPYVAHGDTIQHLPLDPEGEYYHYEKVPFSWWFMSRNRKRPWDGPSYTVVANWRHVTIHPASPTMRLVKSDLGNGWKQTWEFTDEYEHLDGHPDRPKLDVPRRLSWRECALLQTLPAELEPDGDIAAKFWQVGNAVPPRLMEHILRPVVSGAGLRSDRSPDFIEDPSVVSSAHRQVSRKADRSAPAA